MKKEFQPMFDKYGVVRVFTHLGWSVFIADPKLCKEASAKHEIFVKLDFAKVPVSEHLVTFLGLSNVLNNNGADWKRHRKIINPIFNQTWNTELFGECVKDVINDWEKNAGSEIDVHDNIQRMTLDVTGKVLFDYSFNAVKEKESPVYSLVDSITQQLLDKALYQVLPFMEKVPFFRRYNLSKQLNQCNGFIEEVIAVRKKQLHEGNTKSNDLISALIKSGEREDEFKLSNEEIRDNIKLFILAGRVNTSNILATTLYYLTKYPEIQDKMRQEILEVLGHPNELTIPTIDQLKHMPYMNLVIKETMRIMPTVNNVQRNTAETYTLSNGITIPKGTKVFLHLWGIHHNSTAFSNPEKFNPDRFNDLNNEESRNWQPFLSGHRTCLGMTFSLMEQRVTLAMLLQKFEFSITKENQSYEKLKISPAIFVHPQDLSLIVKLRS